MLHLKSWHDTITLQRVSFLFFSAASLLNCSAVAQTVVVPEPPKHTYEADTVRQLQVRGEWGRYLTFTGMTVNSWKGTEASIIGGTPDKTVCTASGSCYTITGSKPQLIPSKPGGTEVKLFTYELDCKDLTFDRKGDKASAGGGNHGWMTVEKDPTAQAVAAKYCPMIETLPGPTSVVTEAKADAVNEQDWTHVAESDDGDFWAIHLKKNAGIALVREVFINAKTKEEEYGFVEYDCTLKRYRYAPEENPYDFEEWQAIGTGTNAESLLEFACSANQK